PYAKVGFTDSRATSFDGMLAFIEHRFGVAPLTARDAVAYDYANSFDFTQRPLEPNRAPQVVIAKAERDGWSAGSEPDD
ncbi:MAG TPA: hypothetical protein VKA30_02700, partial [Actinomycetota bacterium]|nr:hypothetical protein [Actinomycetota bacterium]